MNPRKLNDNNKIIILVFVHRWAKYYIKKICWLKNFLVAISWKSWSDRMKTPFDVNLEFIVTLVSIFSLRSSKSVLVVSAACASIRSPPRECSECDVIDCSICLSPIALLSFSFLILKFSFQLSDRGKESRKCNFNWSCRLVHVACSCFTPRRQRE